MRNNVLLSTRGEFYHTLKGAVKGNPECDKAVLTRRGWKPLLQ